MTPKDIEALAHALQGQGISACEVHDKTHDIGFKLWLRAATPALQAHSTRSAESSEAAAAAAAPRWLRSPGMGRFAARHPLHESPAVTPGQRVEADQTVGYLLIGALVEKITASHAAVLGRQLVEEGELVGYGDAIFQIG
ncbi:biotin carboxyl carrier protein [Comamonas sp. BIGb0152]|uniref:hypothetical protein n=1 Tax=Comamonas sp. BIGb0152 TaxID=2940601 RepID=UPI0021678120|nr:hypothetical protein [Comamonas sp. BIGb0152]MCS4296275.1 biotin carboxyl carrier protein [Comamonas sp. BIGb0152]